MTDAINKPQGIGMPNGIDRAYWIAREYWDKLKAVTRLSELRDEMKAIEFFRNTKPLFTAQVQYFTMLSEVMLFVPEHSDEQKMYWKIELKKYSRFYEKNIEFIDYYDNGDRHLDHVYFTLLKPDLIAEPRMRYDEELAFCSAKDHLVRGILAHRQYDAFVNRQIQLITAKM